MIAARLAAEKLGAAALVAALLVIQPASAAITFIGFGPLPVVGIRVGPPVGVATVSFNVPAALVGSGTPITGTPTIFIAALARFPASDPPPVFTVSVDSSTPLSNGAATIPMTEFSWTSQDGDIPNGTFQGTASQVIFGPATAAIVVSDQLTFSFANDQVYDVGTYVGKVTYTAAVP